MRQTLANKDRRIAVLNRESEQRFRDVERLTGWLERMDAAVSAILGSRQWRVGHALGRIRDGLLSRDAGPTVQKSVARISESFHAWREEHEPGKSCTVTLASQPVSKTKTPSAKPVDGIAETTTPVTKKSPVPRSTATPKRYGFEASEYVLQTLRDLGPVTVIVPIHNAFEEVRICLESLIKNTNFPSELLLINDASTDERIPPLLAEYESLEGVRVLTNEENLGFVRTVNRGISESTGDVVLLNSDAEVTPRWLENLTLAANANPRIATVTAISDNAGAFSVPEIGKKNATPERLSKDQIGRLITQESEQVYPRTPTANGFCMYIKRDALDEVGHFDAESFPRGYGEENDFCMRASKLGWNHVVDDATFIFHRRTASFGEEKQRTIEKARERLDDLHPDYALLARAFVSSEDMKRVGANVREAFEKASANPIRPRILFVIHQAHGGTTFTNEDLMSGVSGNYEPYLLVSNVAQLKLFKHEPNGPVLLEQWDLRGNIQVTEYSRPDYRAIVFGIMAKYRFELVHVRHLVGHTFDLPEIAHQLRISVILSFHDFYFSCPTVHLIDDHGKHCGGICTPGNGQCTLPTKRLQQFPRLKHAYLKTWREEVERMFEHVDAFVTTSNATKEIYLRSLPTLRNRPFRIIEHGRDLEQAHCASPPKEGPIRILLPGNVNPHKGGNFVRELKRLDTEGKLEFHTLGRVAPGYEDLGINHGLFERHEFNDRVREIRPSFMGIFSITPETYCHALTEAWAAGVPVLASDIGTLRERVKTHGGGWLLDFEDPAESYSRILEISADYREYDYELARADLRGIKSIEEMAEDYESLYETVLRGNRRFATRS